MKKIMFLVCVCALLAVGCDNTKGGSGLDVTVLNADVVIPSTTEPSPVRSAQKADEFDGTSYPQIRVKVTFYRQNISYSGTSKPLSPDTRSISMNEIAPDDNQLMSEMSGIVWLICRAFTALCSENYYSALTVIDCWANDYDVTVVYYASDSEEYSDTKHFTITDEEYFEKWKIAGIKPCPVLTYDGAYLGTGETYGDCGFYEYTEEDASKISLDVSFDINIPE